MKPLSLSIIFTINQSTSVHIIYPLCKILYQFLTVCFDVLLGNLIIVFKFVDQYRKFFAKLLCKDFFFVKFMYDINQNLNKGLCELFIIFIIVKIKVFMISKSLIDYPFLHNLRSVIVTSKAEQTILKPYCKIPPGLTLI